MPSEKKEPESPLTASGLLVGLAGIIAVEWVVKSFLWPNWYQAPEWVNPVTAALVAALLLAAGVLALLKRK